MNLSKICRGSAIERDELESRVQQSRKDRNEDLIKRMKRKESLWSYDSKSSWFPPRPVVKKDPQHIREIYGEEEQIIAAPSSESKPETPRSSPAKMGEVVPLKRKV